MYQMHAAYMTRLFQAKIQVVVDLPQFHVPCQFGWVQSISIKIRKYTTVIRIPRSTEHLIYKQVHYLLPQFLKLGYIYFNNILHFFSSDLYPTFMDHCSNPSSPNVPLSWPSLIANWVCESSLDMSLFSIPEATLIALRMEVRNQSMTSGES